MTVEQKPIETVTPTAMAELEIMKNDSAKSVTGRNPEIRSVALLLLAIFGINLLSHLSLLLIADSMGSNHSGVISEFVKSKGLLGIVFLLVQLIAIFVLLFTRSVSVAKIIIIAAAISVVVNIVQGLIGFAVGPNLFFETAILGVNFFIFLKIFRLTGLANYRTHQKFRLHANLR